MGFFTRKTLFDKYFLLNDDKLLFKNTMCINYKNIYDDNYVVQGFTITQDYCMISAYNKFKARSRVYLYEKNGVFKKYVDLDNSSHVGGISYDYLNNIVYITGSCGKINAYDYSELISGNIVKYENDIDISEVVGEKTSASTLYFYDNKLYVCTFEGVGKLIVFDLSFSKKKINILDKKFYNDLPPAIQGICVFEKNNQLYYLFSQSYSRLKSCIKLYDSRFTFLGQIKLNEIGIEGIDIDYSGNVCCIFENGINKVKKIHITEIMHRISNGLEKKYNFKGIKFKEKMDKLS